MLYCEAEKNREKVENTGKTKYFVLIEVWQPCDKHSCCANHLYYQYFTVYLDTDEWPSWCNRTRKVEDLRISRAKRRLMTNDKTASARQSTDLSLHVAGHSQTESVIFCAQNWYFVISFFVNEWRLSLDDCNNILLVHLVGCCVQHDHASPWIWFLYTKKKIMWKTTVRMHCQQEKYLIKVVCFIGKPKWAAKMLSSQVIVAAHLMLSHRFHFIVCVLMLMLRITRVALSCRRTTSDSKVITVICLILIFVNYLLILLNYT